MAPTVLALHGITSNGRAWDAVARELDGDVRLLAPDLRGRGDAGGQPGPYGLARHVQDAVDLLDAEGLDTAVVAGHSMGAYVTALLAATHPGRVESVVLVDGGPPLPVPEGADPDALLEATLGPSIERLSREFETPEAYHEFWRAHPAFAGYDVADGDLTAYADHDLRGEPPHLRSSVAEDAVRTDGRELIADHDVRTALDAVRAPGRAAARPAGAAGPARGLHPRGHGRGLRPPHGGAARGARQQPLHDPDGRGRRPRGGGRDPRRCALGRHAAAPGSATTPSQKSSMEFTTSMKRSRLTGLRM